jgi:chemotaxis protein CheX
VNDDVLDAVAEVTNMVIGNVKTVLEERLGAMGLSIPTVIYGRNFSSRTVGKQNWTVVPFTLGNERLEVQLCLAPNREPRPRLALADQEPVRV